MFQKIGRKLIQGAKAELSEKPVVDPELAMTGIKLALEIGICLLVIFGGKKADHQLVRTPTIVVNNYISKGDT